MDVKEIYQDLIEDDGYWTKNPGRKPGVQSFVLTQIKSIGARKVLDAGCGRGHLSAFLVKKGYDVDGCDLANPGRHRIKGAWDFTQAPLTKLPYENDHFDCVICVDVIEHLYESEIEDAIAEMFRVGKHLFIRIACFESHYKRYKQLHLTMNPPKWWRKQVQSYGEILFDESSPPTKKRVTHSMMVRKDENRIL